MKKRILIELLSSFSKIELSKFKRFIAADYFNTDERVMKLLEVIHEKILLPKQFDEFPEQEIYQCVFGKPSRAVSALNASQKALFVAKMSLLMNLAKKFLAVEAMKEKPACERELLYHKLLAKKQYRVMERQLRADKKRLKNTRMKSLRDYDFAVRVEDGLLNYYNHTEQLAYSENINDLIKAIDMGYLLKKLSLHQTALSLTQAAVVFNLDIRSLESAQQLCKINNYGKESLVVLYNAAIVLMQKNRDKDYINFLDQLEIHGVRISREKRVDFYNVAANFCAAQIRRGQMSYFRKVFELYKIQDEKNLLLEEGMIPVIKFKNLIGVGCRNKEYEWTTKFVKKYQDFIYKPLRKSVCVFGYGVIAFYKGDYKKAKMYLQEVGEINVSYETNKRLLLARINYELDGEYNMKTETELRTAERYFKETKSLANEHKVSHQHFVALLINLYRIRHHQGGMNLKRIQDKLNRYKFISGKAWLQKKINELLDREE